METEDFFDFMDKLLSQELPEQPQLRQRVMRDIQKQHLEMIKSTPLDELELMATPVANRKAAAPPRVAPPTQAAVAAPGSSTQQ